MVLPDGLFRIESFMPKVSLFSDRESTFTGDPALVGTYLTAFEISSEDDEFSSTSPCSISSGASQSCLRSRLISFLPLSRHNKVLFQSRLFEEGDLTKLCQMVLGDLPKCASKGEQLSDCWVTVLKHFIIFRSADSSEGFGRSCAITKSLSLMVLIRRSTSPVAL